MAKALEGIRVLEVTVYLAGPFCGTMFTALGADVIKIESPSGGDPVRLTGPYGGADGVKSERTTAEDISLTFLKRTAGKKSVTLNLKSKEGHELFLRLAQTADVVLENLQPGLMQRFGLDYEAVRAVNPDTVYCSISGFGQTGQYRNMLAFDPIIQAMAGLMSLNGFADSPPVRAGYYAADVTAPLFASFAVLAALRHRDRAKGSTWTLRCWIASKPPSGKSRWTTMWPRVCPCGRAIAPRGPPPWNATRRKTAT